MQDHTPPAAGGLALYQGRVRGSFLLPLDLHPLNFHVGYFMTERTAIKF